MADVSTDPAVTLQAYLDREVVQTVLAKQLQQQEVSRRAVIATVPA